MKALFALALALVIGCGAAAQEQAAKPLPDTVSIEAKGTDVRSVLHDLFVQSGRNYVIEPGIRYVLYLSLKEVKFEEALDLILELAELQATVDGGVVRIGKRKSPPKPTPPPPAKRIEVVAGFSEIQRAPAGKLPTSVLAKRITTRFAKIDLRDLFASFTEQTGVVFEIDPKVPGYKIDAFLINTSLKYALDNIARSARLSYRFTENRTISIAPADAVGERPDGMHSRSAKPGK